jgi:hypothetical protein
MAIDVFLIIFYKYIAPHLRKLEIKYIAIITAITFIPALTFLFIHTPKRGPMYGSVTVSAFVFSRMLNRWLILWQIWCSISRNWVLFRIVFFCGPIWYVFSAKGLRCCSNPVSLSI